jgi:exodeoxyribonuclease V alpha subunit
LPLVLDGSARLYLGRYWHYEQVVADAIAARARGLAEGVDRVRLAAGLNRLFPAQVAGEVDWQRVAAAMAVLRPFCVISGGPGTGKTRTVTAILALLIDQARARGGLPRIGLAAPTGKAAARLTESIRAARADLLAAGALEAELAAAIPEDGVTLHRLLGTRPGRVAPRHGPDNPLHLDLLVVDEASMLDLPLAARLVSALPPGCRLIPLGDRDQLASVQAGSVLGDICGRGQEPAWSPDLLAALVEVGALPATGSGRQAPDPRASAGLGDGVALLRRSFRFRPGSGIHAVASAIQQGDGAGVAAALDAGHPDARRLDLDGDGLARFVGAFVVARHRAVLAAPDPAAALRAFGTFRLLCAVREGPLGLATLNRIAEQALAGAGVIRPEGGRYAGRPLMVTANDYALRLYNGDVGLLLPDPDAGGELRAWFETADGLRRLSPHRLPPVETLYAMTVHKSQGSEFNEVVLVLPPQDSRVVTRELIYTGVTRARWVLTLIAGTARLVQGVERRVQRSSGLYDALWSPGAATD